jgi:hypothetical protein
MGELGVHAVHREWIRPLSFEVAAPDKTALETQEVVVMVVVLCSLLLERRSISTGQFWREAKEGLEDPRHPIKAEVEVLVLVV